MNELIDQYVDDAIGEETKYRSFLKKTPSFEAIRLGNSKFFFYCFESSNYSTQPSPNHLLKVEDRAVESGLEDEIEDFDLPNYYDYT